MPDRGAVAVGRGSGHTPTVGWNPSAWRVACSMIAAVLALGCDHTPGPGPVQGTVTLVNRVRATMRGVSCADCGARLQAALAKRLDPATITVVPPGDRVEVEFERSETPFSSASFRSAVAETGGEVLSVRIEACGTIETTPQGSWMTSGSTRLLLEGPGSWTPGTQLCVTGDLRDDSSPARLVVGRIGS
jgi:hypothetical protein